MNNVICECCYVVHGWIRTCNCRRGPTRTDPTNPFGLKEPWINTSMGRNEKSDEEWAEQTKRLKQARADALPSPDQPAATPARSANQGEAQ